MHLPHAPTPQQPHSSPNTLAHSSSRAPASETQPRRLRRLCVFCGAQSGSRPVYRETAEALGRAMAAHGIGLVFGGGAIGLMGVVGTAVMEAGGEAIGVIPDGLVRREAGHQALTELRVVPSMHARKAMMAELADGFIAMPGGFGTLEEAVEILTWGQLGIHRKGLVFLDTNQFWSRQQAAFDHMVAEGFMRPEIRALASFQPTVETALDHLAGFVSPPGLEPWEAPRETPAP